MSHDPAASQLHDALRKCYSMLSAADETLQLLYEGTHDPMTPATWEMVHDMHEEAFTAASEALDAYAKWDSRSPAQLQVAEWLDLGNMSSGEFPPRNLAEIYDAANAICDDEYVIEILGRPEFIADNGLKYAVALGCCVTRSETES